MRRNVSIAPTEALVSGDHPSAEATGATGDVAPRGSPDGMVNVADLLVLVRLVEGLGAPPTLAELAAGDLNGDHVLDLRDVLALMHRLEY